MRYIEDLKEDERVCDHYLCKQRRSLKSRNGKTYLSLTLQDKTGTIEAKVWEMNKDIQSFDSGDFVKIDATVLMYQNDLQMKVTRLRKSQEGEYEPMDYIPCSDKDISDLYSKIMDYIKSLTNSYIKQLMENIFTKNAYISESFKKHSAAKNMHHSYMGGLVEHTLNVVEICEFLGSRYKFVNRDLLIATAILHDLGKVYELSEFPENDYTDDGQLLGHIVICVDLVSKEMDKIPNFPHQLQSLIKHSILSHHGEYEYGSPKRPKTIEAYILHCADNTDAKMKAFEEAIEDDSSSRTWVGLNRMLGRNIRKSDYNGNEFNG